MIRTPASLAKSGAAAIRSTATARRPPTPATPAGRRATRGTEICRAATPATPADQRATPGTVTGQLTTPDMGTGRLGRLATATVRHPWTLVTTTARPGQTATTRVPATPGLVPGCRQTHGSRLTHTWQVTHGSRQIHGSRPTHASPLRLSVGWTQDSRLTLAAQIPGLLEIPG
jgi:hypothetical protein